MKYELVAGFETHVELATNKGSGICYPRRTCN